MSGRRLQSAVREGLCSRIFGARWIAIAMAVVASMAFARTAHAEESIIKRPGDHPVYSVEIEPHLTLAFIIPAAGSSGVGLGGRFTIPIVRNGFVSSINNSVGIGVGLDWIHYNGCYRNWGNPYACTNFETFVLPVVMQWNFFLSTHWSVFGEPGLAITINSYGSCVDFYLDPQGRRIACGSAPSTLGVNPFVLFVGGRYHFNETTALTMRLGWPYASIGVSFMP